MEFKCDKCEPGMTRTDDSEFEEALEEKLRPHNGILSHSDAKEVVRWGYVRGITAERAEWNKHMRDTINSRENIPFPVRDARIQKLEADQKILVEALEKIKQLEGKKTVEHEEVFDHRGRKVGARLTEKTAPLISSYAIAHEALERIKERKE